MTVLDMTLRLSEASRTRFCRMVADGVRLTCQTWADARRPRETVRDFATADQAVEGFHAYRRKKMREGFAYVVDPAEAGRGDTLLYLKAPLRCTGGFDLSPDGRTIVTGGFHDGTNSAEFHLIDAATNLRRLVHSVPPAPGLAKPLPHAVLFDAAAERVVFAVGGETRLLDLASGGTRTLAAYVQSKSAHFNPFRLRPMWDARRERLLVFDRDDSVRVLDPDGDELFRTSAARQPAECWVAGLSPSGKLLALCFAQGSRYSEDAPQTVEIEIWDVDAPRTAGPAATVGPSHPTAQPWPSAGAVRSPYSTPQPAATTPPSTPVPTTAERAAPTSSNSMPPKPW